MGNMGAGDVVASVLSIDLEDIYLGRNWSRRRLTRASVARMVASIQAAGGIQQPVLVRPVEVDHPGPETYELVAGFRRYAAARELGWEALPALVDRSLVEPADAQLANLLENVPREKVTTFDEATAYVERLEMTGETPEHVAALLGVPATRIKRLAALRVGLPAALLDVLRTDATPETVSVLFDIATMPRLLEERDEDYVQRQMREWARRLREDDADDPTDVPAETLVAEPTKHPGGPGRKVGGMNAITKALIRLRESSSVLLGGDWTPLTSRDRRVATAILRAVLSKKEMLR